MTEQQPAPGSARHRAARLEDAFNGVVVRHLSERGWLPRVVAYPGYGLAAGPDGPGWVRVLARVQLTRTRPGEESPEEADERHLLVRGWRSFVTAPVAEAAVGVDVGGQRHDIVADRGGYVDVVLPSSLPAGEQQVLLHPPGGGGAVTTTVHVVGRDPVLGIVSDIDDTVMMTSLPRPLIAAWNTFVLNAGARGVVTGMADLYADVLAGHPGAPVVYLSTGAWNVAPTLRRFLRRHLFPLGPLLLTDWGPTNSGWFRSGRDHKRAALTRLVGELPHVRWLLVGDDGQHDPQIYAEVARDHPGHVAAIAIRRLTPVEQVLSHGLPVPVSGTEDVGVPAVSGGDGYALAFALRGKLAGDATA